VITS
jgi:hypothetical protein